MTILAIVAMFLKNKQISHSYVIAGTYEDIYLARSDAGLGISRKMQAVPYIRMYSTNHFILISTKHISELANNRIYDITDPNCFDKLYKDLILLKEKGLITGQSENPMDD